jgi:hypothetical protein
MDKNPESRINIPDPYQWFFLLFLLDERRIRIKKPYLVTNPDQGGPKHMNPDPQQYLFESERDPNQKGIRIKWKDIIRIRIKVMRIRNTGSRYVASHLSC